MELYQMEAETLEKFVKELFEAVSIGSVDKVKIIFGSYVNAIENTFLKGVSNLKIHQNDSSDISTLNVPENGYNEICSLMFLVNCKSKHGRTLLQTAARLGYDEICKLLIDKGAGIDTTTLVLAAVNNHINVVRLLMKYNAAVRNTDLVYKTADAAASMGYENVKDMMHYCMINRALHPFMKTENLNISRKLKIALRELMMEENRYFVRLIMYLKESRIILENLRKCVIILRVLCEQQFIKENNEKLSWEFHEIAYTFGFADYYLGCYKAYHSTASVHYILDSLIRGLLKYQPKNDISPRVAFHVKAISSTYPFKDSNIYRTKAVPVNSIYNKSTLWEKCETCRNCHNLKICTGCKNILYCSITCQNLHWFVHLTDCK